MNGELKNLKATLRFAVEEKLIPEMRFKIRMLKEVKRRTTHIFTREEIQRLLDEADGRTRALLLIASATGMRIGEIRHLQVSNRFKYRSTPTPSVRGDFPVRAAPLVQDLSHPPGAGPRRVR